MAGDRYSSAVRRVTFEPDMRALEPQLSEVVDAIADESTPLDTVAVLLQDAARLATTTGCSGIRIEVEPVSDELDRICRDDGFELQRTMLQLRRSLPLESRLRPDNDFVLENLRPFRPGHDDQAWIAVNHQAFAWHPEQGNWTLDDLAERLSESWFQSDGFLVLDDIIDGLPTGQLIGFCWAKIHYDIDPHLGEIFVIGVDPANQSRGMGRALVWAGLNWLGHCGVTDAMLYVEGDNESALHVYRSLGFTPTAAHRWWYKAL